MTYHFDEQGFYSYKFDGDEYHLAMITNNSLSFVDNVDGQMIYEIIVAFKEHPLELPGLNFERYLLKGQIELQLFWPRGKEVRVRIYNKQWITT